MKVLILSITAGEGHNSTAKAVKDCLDERGIDSRILDTYDYISPVLGETVSRGYLLSTEISPKTYRRVYRLGERKEKNSSPHSVMNITNSILAMKLKEYISEYQPNCIVCTHIFSAMIINALKMKGKLQNIFSIGIVTDFTIHPFWPDLDYIDGIVTASELLENEARRKGMDVTKLLPFGIPIKPKFSHTIDKTEARRQLGIHEDKYTVLLMGGSMGFGHLDSNLRELCSLDLDFQVLSVCGNNKRKKHIIDELLAEGALKKPVYNFGFVDNVDVMMDAADCIITKPGGLTTSEALAKGLPMIIINPIPGQEERNAEFLLNNGLAQQVTDTYPLSDALYQFFYYPEKVQNLRRNIRIVGKKGSTERLCDYIMEQCAGAEK